MKNKALSFRDNTLINMNVIEGAVSVGVKKMTCMGSGCVYPYPSPGLPLNEDMIWMGAPHASEDSYAHSKRAMLAQLNAYKESYGLDFAFVISGNLYGPHDKFDTEYGHVTPSLVRKFYEASLTGEEIVVWGDGSAQRDFMFSEDTGEALIAIMKSVLGSVNMGSGAVNSIRDIVDILADITGGQAQIVWDSSKPNGQDYRAYNLDKLSETGFKPNVCLREGLEKTYAWYKEHADKARK
jgi:GDP-L-fucose synthase